MLDEKTFLCLKIYQKKNLSTFSFANSVRFSRIQKDQTNFLFVPSEVLIIAQMNNRNSRKEC